MRYTSETQYPIDWNRLMPVHAFYMMINLSDINAIADKIYVCGFEAYLILLYQSF